MSEMSSNTTKNKRRKVKKIGNVKISFYFENSVAHKTTTIAKTKKGSLKVNLCVELKDY